MAFKKKRLLLLFFLFLGLLPIAYSKTCSELFCPSLGKVCISDYSNESNARCVDSCKENSLAVAPVGSCAINRNYCSAGSVLRDKCDVCGCPKGEKCQIEGTCQKVCKDGTLDGQCAAIKPFYCDNGNLVQKSTVCGCEEGKVSQSDGTCGIGAEMTETTYSDFLKGSYAGAIASRAPNIALEGTAFASGAYEAPSSWWCKPSADKANDGKLRHECDWVSPVSSSITQRDQYIGIEWNEDKTFNEIVFTQSFLQAKSYKIQSFRDGKWIDATKEKFLEHYPKDFAKLEENIGEIQIAERAVFEPVTSKKARIFFPQCYSACRIFEMEVYNSSKSSLKSDTANGFTSAEYISKVYDTQTTQNNITYDKLFFTTHVEAPKKSKSVNIAPLAQVTASSTYNLPFFDQSNLNDETYTEYVPSLSNYYITGWASNSMSNQWVSFMFPQKRRINKLVFLQMQRHHKNFEIRSWDGIKWAAVVPRTSLPYYPNNYPTDDFTLNYTAEVVVSFDAIETQGIQLFFPECYNSCYLREVLIYEELEAASQPKNIALEGTAIASSRYSDAWNESFVNDGFESTMWSAYSYDGTDWIGMQWPTARTINKVRMLQWMPHVICNNFYHLQYWDGNTWRDINRAYNKGTPDDFHLDCINGYDVMKIFTTEDLFTPVTTAKIRILPEPNWHGWPDISEIQVYEAVQ